MQQLNIQDIAELLIKTGAVLEKSQFPQKESGIIRTLQYQLNLPYNANAPSLRCLVFFLDLIIDDFFYNLSGDGPYNDLIIEIRANVYRQFGKTLQELGGLLAEGDTPLSRNVFCELITVYTAELNRLDDTITRNFQGHKETK